MRKSLIGLVGLCLTLAVLIQVPAINTPLLQGFLNILLKQKEIRVDIHGQSGFFPISLSADHIEVSDKKGLCIDIKDFHYSWKARELFNWNVHLDEISADRLQVFRIPEKLLERDDDPIRIPYINIDHFLVKHVQIPSLDSEDRTFKGVLKSTPKDEHTLQLKLLTHNNEKDFQPKIQIDYSQSVLNYQANIVVNEGVGKLKALFPSFFNSFYQGHLTLSAKLQGKSDFVVLDGDLILDGQSLSSTHPSIQTVIGKSLKADIHFHMNPTPALPVKAVYPLLQISKGKISTDQGALSEVSYDLSLHPEGETGHFLKTSFDSPIFHSTLLVSMKQKEGSFDLENIEFVGDGLSLSGNGKTSLMGGHSVHVKGKAEQLKSLGKLLGLKLGGQCAVDCHIQNDVVNINGNAKDLTVWLDDQLLDVKDGLIKANLKGGKGEVALQMESSLGTIGISGIFSRPTDTIHQLDLKKMDYSYNKKKIFSLDKGGAILATEEYISIPQATMRIGDGIVTIRKLKIGTTQTNHEGEITLSNLTIESLKELFTTTFIDTSLRGKLNGKFQFNPTEHSSGIPYYLTLSLHHFGLKDTTRKLAKAVDFDFQATHSGHSLTWKGGIVGAKDAIKDCNLAFSGSAITNRFLPIRGDSFKSTMQGDFDLSILNPLVWWGDRYKGLLHLTISSEGILGVAPLRGTIGLRDGYYENAEFGTVLKDVTLQGNLDRNDLIIKNISARDLVKGKITGEGRIDFKDVLNPAINLNIHLHKILLANNDETTLRASGQIHLVNSAQKPMLIKGQLELDSALVVLENASLEPKTIILYRDEIELERKGNKRAKDSNTLIDMSIKIPDKLFIQGFGLYSEWKGDLKLQGPVNAFDIKGNIQSLKGHIDVANKRLTLDPSQVSFTRITEKTGRQAEKSDLVPILKIRASKTVGDYKASVMISGLASEPQISFSSEPALSTEGVIALILFNKPLQNVTAAQALQLATAIAPLKAGALTGGAFNSLNQILGVDEVSFQDQDKTKSVGANLVPVADEASPEEKGKTTLRVGKQLNDHIYVGVDHNLREGNKTKALMEIDITKNTKLSLGSGTEDSSIGYNWEMRY